MQPIPQGGGDLGHITVFQCAQQHRQMRSIIYRVPERNGGGQDGAGGMGAQRKIRRQSHKPQGGMGRISDGVHLAILQHGGGEAAVKSRCQVVRVPFDAGGQGDQRIGG